jgi:hypothetical protein
VPKPKSRKRRRPPAKEFREFRRTLAFRSSARPRIRSRLVAVILSERKGFWRDGKQVVNRYRYDVGTLKDGRGVYLRRPTYLNKGIDFQVWVEKLRRKKGKWTDARPRHRDIHADLAKKRQENPAARKQLLRAIESIYSGIPPERLLARFRVRYQKGYPLDLTLTVLSWLFIEQDLTYWNYDGRTTLMREIRKRFSRKS